MCSMISWDMLAPSLRRSGCPGRSGRTGSRLSRRRSERSRSARPRHHGTQPGGHHPGRPGAGARAGARWLAGRMADLPGAPAGHLGAVAAIVDIAQGLEVDSERMRTNLGETRWADHGRGGGPSRSPARSGSPKPAPSSRRRAAGRPPPNAICRRSWPRTSGSEPHLGIGDLAELFEPMAYQGSAQTFIDRIVGSLQLRTSKRT